MDPAKILERFLDRPRVAALRTVLDVYGHAPGGLLANGLAFAALFAAFPVALVTLGVAGLLVDDPTIQAQLAQTIGTLFPPLAELVDQALGHPVQWRGGHVESSGSSALIWTVSQFYVTLDIAFARVFADRRERDVFWRTARGFVSVAGLVGIVVALIVGLSLAAAAEAFLPASSSALTGLRGAAVVAAGTDGPRGRCRHGRLPGRAIAGAILAGDRAPGDRGRGRDRRC